MAKPVFPVSIKRFLPLIALAAIALALWWSGLAEHLSWAELARRQAGMREFVAAWPALAPFVYVLTYTVFVALSLPQAVVITITGGLLFGTVAGGALAILGATLGATVLFLIARGAFGDALARKGGAGGGAFVTTLRDGLARDGFNYLLALRLVPAFPFWLVNLAAALGGMRLAPYFAATLIGIAPGTFVFASIGAGVGEVLATGGTPDLTVILSLPVLGPILGLAALSLLPIAWRRWRKTDARL
jgi:uncharacterized membrane protein YdjX (TVP38/TMEM64 family)